MLSQSQTQSHSSGDVSKQSRALTGTVTKLLDNFGFIDDSVFFQLSVVKGGDVQVGDKVYCECSYSEHLPFKWNATKVHLVQTNSRTGNQSAQSGSQSSASQVATTYLQHRLQQQQTREESANPMSGILNTSQNYYSSQSVSNPSYASQQSFDFSKAQQAVVAAQQLANYYGRNDSANANSFSQLQYTSTPGSAFVSSTLPFTQQIQQNLLSTQPRTPAQNSFKSNASRWEREERNNRTEDRFRSRDGGRKRNDSRDRNNVSKEGRDEFGRDLRSGDKTKDRDKEREREREKIEKERERRLKRSESPNSISSQNVLVRAPRRRYEPVNIPKLAILKSPLNVYDIKQRYSASLHIPSDLKEVIVNTKFSLNINDIPKPVTFRVIEIKDKDSSEHKKKEKESPKKSDSPKEKENKENSDKSENKEETNGNKSEVIEIDDSNSKTENKDKDKTSVEQPIALKQSYKYGVKVLIISLPSMSDIYDRIFGSDFDAISTGTKSYFLHFNKLLAFLVSRNSNDGFSLIGGKFSPQSDGYLADSEEPNLIATAIRVVGEQTGMNLSKCGKWKLIATFIYNRDNSVDPMSPNLELTRVYMPDVWSAFDGIYDTLKNGKNIDLENNDFENVLNNEKLENNIEVVVNTNDKNELISAEECSADKELSPNSLPENSGPIGVEPSPDSDSVMDLTQSNATESEEINSQSIESEIPIVETITDSETTCTPSTAIDLTSTPNDSSEPPVVDLSSVDNSSPKPEEPNEDIECPTETNVDSEPQTSSVDESTATAVEQKDGSEMETTDNTTTPPVVEKTVSSGDVSELHELLSRINDLKVAELRAELEKRGARIKGNLKKADLITKLRQIITQLLDDENVVSDDVKNDWWAQRILSKESADNENSDDNEKEAGDKPIESIDESIINEETTDKTAVESDSDVVMTEKENEDKECIEIIDEKEEQMVIDITDDKTDESNTETTNTENKDKENESESQNKDKEETQKKTITQNGTVKRKTDSQTPSKESKKAKNGEESQEVIPKKVTDGCVYVKGGENMTVITLHEALNHQRYDQFEMSIVSELIRESLIHHFSHYILSTLVFNHKNPVSKEEKTSSDLKQTPLPVNYVHLSFAYFDSSHCGHILSEDLAKLLNNANFTLSRRAFNLLVNTEEKILYRDLIEPKELLAIKTETKIGSEDKSPDNQSNVTKVQIYEKNGTVYDIEQLIDLSESDEKLKVRLNEELTTNKEKISQLSEYIQELESRQKKMTIATEKQNDEICSLKRERELMKTKYESMRKAVESSVSAFNKVLENQNEDK